ncbi:MAG: PfaD family polyunsaturated fatty acid/polyketide biosynthesis protein [Elusimicrobia bacterium]|nr:PfaD family polyunsaturated fatty acid/polyketide biosynthesis protein [Elusimicrobiota bacterium]
MIAHATTPLTPSSSIAAPREFSVRPEDLGDPAFLAAHGLKYAYAAGAMANGIGSVEIVEAMGRAGMLGFFGAAGLTPNLVEAAITRLQADLGSVPHGINLIHSPNEPDLESKLVDLYLRKGVRLVEASAYLALTLPIVRYRLSGIRRGPSGEALASNKVIAKVSRVEVAAKFFSPAPEAMVRELVGRGELTEDQAALSRELPVATDLTAEADSGGHTDNRPLVTLLPTMIALRDRLQDQFAYREALRVGAAGGIATPQSAAAAFLMGAAYVLTGSVNQACVESGSSDVVRGMLAAAAQADTAMAPAADMFEMGVKVQILKRGTMFAMRAAKLYEVYRSCESIETIPPAMKVQLERDLFRAPLEEVWKKTREFFLERDPSQAQRAERDPKHKMALVFRWYLGLSSRWANAGEPSRQLDYQVWCGPAMGAFNEWARGSFLEDPKERRVVVVALNILAGAAGLTRAHFLRLSGRPVEPELSRFSPKRLEELRPEVV